MRRAFFSTFLALLPLLGVCGVLCGCTIERAEEQIVEMHANGIKKTSVWVYPDGEILKRNEWYNNGIKEFEIPYKNGVPHGNIKRWTVLGDVALDGEYRNGKREGKWTSYFVDRLNSRRKEAVRYYRDDHPVGDWEGWHFNGNKAFEEHYSESGDSVGVWKKWYENGVLADSNSCFGKVERGFRKVFHDNGRPDIAFECQNGIRHGVYVRYYDNGSHSIAEAATYSHGDISGMRREFLASGVVIKHESWKAGQRDGAWEWLDSTGNKIRESLFENGTGTAYGIRDGVVLAETTFVAGNPEKIWYMRDGHSLRYEETWRDGMIAESRSFYPDTLGDSIAYVKPASEGAWKDGKREGIWRNWYKSGVLRDSLTYVNGERIGEQFSYDSTGKLTIHKTEAGKNRPVIMHIPGEK